MAYADKYKITYATKTSKTAYLYLQEDGYSGSIIEYQGTQLQLQYLPTSDDQFEPIFASQLNVTLDITDNLSNMPDFVTTNDRKYFAKLYLGSDLEWTGFTINDNVQISFSTGRKQLSFNCVDGLGMLKSILLPISSSVNINDSQSILYYTMLCLNALNLPTTPNLVTACSYYAVGMNDRGTSTSNEPFSQSYFPYRTFLNTPTTYIDCFTILNDIVKGFGCRLFMAKGKWWIISVNEFAQTSVYYTEYSYSSSIVGSGQFNVSSQIQGYTGNTSGLFFSGGSQIKLLRKGYNNVTLSHQYKSAVNYLSNGNLKPYFSDVPVNWNTAYGGTGSSYTIINNANEVSAQYRLVAGTASGSYVRIYALGMPKVNGNDILNFNWTYYAQDTGGYRGNIYVKIVGTSSTYYYGGTPATWNTSSFTNFFPIPSTTTDNVNGYSITLPPAPIDGDLSFHFALEDGTVRYLIIGNFSLTITPFEKQIDYKSFINTNTQYSKSIDLNYGVYANTTYGTSIGTLTNSSGLTWSTWYQYGKGVNYAGLSGLLMQNYINIYGQKIINIDGTLTSFETANGYLDAAKMFTATDTDPSQINVSSNSYLLGNSTIDYVIDSSNVTLLQISNTDISATNNYVITYNNNSQ